MRSRSVITADCQQVLAKFSCGCFKVKATTTEFLKGNKILMKEQIALHQRDIFYYKEYLHVAVS